MPDERQYVWTALTVVTAVAAVVLVSAVVLGFAVPGISAPGAASDAGAGDHENPSSVSTDAELGALERQLASRVQQQVESGALNLSREDYEMAREQVGDEQYEQLLDEYGDVASGTDAEQRQQRFQRAQRTQQQYTILVATYWEQYDEYEALERTTDSNPVLSSIPITNHSARRLALARDLERTTQNLTATANRTITRYEELDENTDESYETIIRSIAQSHENVTETQETVREEQFIRTNLTLAHTEPAHISPTDSLEIEGRLSTLDGDPVANEPVPLEVGEQVLQTRSNETGWFEAEYYPTQLPANSTAVTIRYAPVNESIYLGDEQTRNVTVGSATPTVSISANPFEVRYNSTVTLTGSVGLDGETFAGVPFGVFLDGELLVRNETRVDGAIRESVQVPAAVEAGEQELSVRLLLTAQALDRANETTPLAVRETRTSLQVDAEQTEEGTLLISGRVTAEDTVVDDQPLELSVNGTAVGTTRTDGNGEFRQQVIVPDSVRSDIDGEGTVEVRAAFDGEGTSLSASSATTLTTVTSASGGLALAPWMVVPPGVLAALGAAYLLVTRLSRRRSGGAPQGGTAAESDATVTQSTDAPSYLDRAGEFLDAGEPAAAVQASYAAVQHHLADERRPAQTHWEFYHTSRERLDEDASAALRKATEGYERATFAPTAVDSTTARDVLDAVERLTETDSAASLDD